MQIPPVTPHFSLGYPGLALQITVPGVSCCTGRLSIRPLVADLIFGPVEISGAFILEPGMVRANSLDERVTSCPLPPPIYHDREWNRKPDSESDATRRKRALKMGLVDIA